MKNKHGRPRPVVSVLLRNTTFATTYTGLVNVAQRLYSMHQYDQTGWSLEWRRLKGTWRWCTWCPVRSVTFTRRNDVHLIFGRVPRRVNQYGAGQAPPFHALALRRVGAAVTPSCVAQSVLWSRGEQTWKPKIIISRTNTSKNSYLIT